LKTRRNVSFAAQGAVAGSVEQAIRQATALTKNNRKKKVLFISSAIRSRR